MGQQVSAFQQHIQGPVRLPALTKNIHKLIDLLADENISCYQLGKVISCYPEVSVRLLSLVNSVWSAPVKPILDIETACVRLGLSIVKSVSIAVAVGSFFDSRRCPGFDAERFWTKSMLVAEASYLLANNLPACDANRDDKQAAQTGGLLHNLGILWLADNLPEETAKAFKMYESDPAVTINQALKRCTGADYCEVNAWIAQQWRLPETLAIVMEHHLEVNYKDQSWEITLLVNAAIEMAWAALNTVENIDEHTILTQLGIGFAQQTKIYQQLCRNQDKVREMAAALFTGKI